MACSSAFSCLSPVTTSSAGAAMSSRSPWTSYHLVNVGIPVCRSASKECILRPFLPELRNINKKRRRCSAWPAGRFPEAWLKFAAGDAEEDANGKEKSAFVRSSGVSINQIIGHRRSGDYELQQDFFSGDEINEVTDFAVALRRTGSSVVDDASIGSHGGEGKKEKLASNICRCHMCGRRGLIASLGGLLASSLNIRSASASSFESSDYNVRSSCVYPAIREAVHPARPPWYEELYAQTMARTMVSYEAEVADYKRQLFHNLDEKVEHILELGIGTGPNLKYYGNLPHLQRVVGVDPNLQMVKYCKESATAAGLSNLQFEFLNAVGEGLPVRDETIDAVVCTLTLCSVTDVTSTLEEVKRVLRPGGAFFFVEHVGAPDGSGLRFWQGLLDPLQQWVADGCHLTRNTLQYIESQFGSVQSKRFTVSSVSLIGPHIMGVAYK